MKTANLLQKYAIAHIVQHGSTIPLCIASHHRLRLEHYNAPS